ncbi:MAG: hypothetical protein ACPL7A_00215 [Anaerolineales bacterium]
MGEMQGIVENETDYQCDITSFDFKQKSASIGYFSDYFSNSLPRNSTPSNLIYDLERKGSQDKYQLDAVYPVNSSLVVGMGYSKETRDFRSSYVNSRGNTQTLKRTGNTELKNIIVGYALVDWFNLGLAYDDNIQNDDFTGTEISREGVIAKESSCFRGLSYGIKMHTPSFWFNLSLGEIKEGNITSQTISTTEVYRSSGPGRISLLIGGKLLDGRLRINYGVFGRKITYGFQTMSLLGMQITPHEDLIIGLGFTYDLSSGRYLDLYNLFSKIGFEYAVPHIEGFKFRAGLINKTVGARNFRFILPAEANFQDYALGFGYKWRNFNLDFAYKNYQNVPGGTNSWAAFSTPLSFDYVYTPSSERNSVYAFSASYEI